MMDSELFEADVTERRERAAALFPGAGRELLRTTAAIMAGSCRRAIDYIEQAPVCVLMEGANFGIFNPANSQPMRSLRDHVRPKLAASFAARVARAPKLRAMLRDIWEMLPHGACRPVTGPAPDGLYQLRVFRGTGIRQNRYGALMMLARIAPSTLAQIIPAGATHQERWLGAMSGWLALMRRRLDPRHPPVLLYRAVIVAARAALTMRTVEAGAHMGDFMVAHPESMTGNWPVTRMLDEIAAWTFEQRELLPTFQDATVVDYTPLPNDDMIAGGFLFAPLRTHAALVIESTVMRNCVASYWGAVRAGASRIFSVRTGDGNRIATLELVRRAGAWVNIQIKGHSNCATPKIVNDAARTFADIQNFARATFPPRDEEIA